MAGEDVGGASERPDDSLEGWLDAKADELGVSRTELVARLQNGDGLDGADAPGGVDGLDGADELDGEFETERLEFAEQVAAAREEFEAELDDVEGDFDEKIQDVRERVIQVKRETDAKAPADHAHDDLRQQTEEMAARTDRLAAELDDLFETVEDLSETVDTGFENFEDVLEYLTEATDDLEAKLTTLAETTVELRDQTQSLSARQSSRAAADELAHLANRRGIESADCGHCGETVHIGLLAEPNCPHCASTFNDVEPKQGFFGSPTLLVGDPPALEGERADWDVESVMDADPHDLGEKLDGILEDDE